jgi:alpha-beta hydrolase superfamily lysophospholipase
MQFVLVLFAVVGVWLIALYALQRKLIYFPTRVAPAQFEAMARTAFGERATILAPFDGVVLEPPDDLPVRATAILFHGNAGLAIDRGYLAPICATRGLRLILAEYPGYGSRVGTPTERSLVDDAEALYDVVLRRYPRSPIVLVGESLGAAVAVQVAARARTPPARLVLLTPFLSLAETAARAYPFLPVRHLLRDRFDSASQLARYPGPVAILVAGSDDVVGAAQGRSLASLARSRGETEFVEIPEAGHNNWPALMTATRWTALLDEASIARRP